jgi:hypothetical protein
MEMAKKLSGALVDDNGGEAVHAGHRGNLHCGGLDHLALNQEDNYQKDPDVLQTAVSLWKSSPRFGHWLAFCLRELCPRRVLHRFYR